MGTEVEEGAETPRPVRRGWLEDRAPGQGSSWSWSWLVLPLCETLIQKPYLNAFNYLNASGKKPGSLCLRQITWTSQIHKFNDNKSFLSENI